MSNDARDMFARFLMEKYSRAIRKIVLQVLRDENNFDDVMQTVILKCADKHEMLENMHEKKVMAYICTATRNTCLNEIRSREAENRRIEKYYESKLVEYKPDIIDFEAFDDKYGFSEEIQALLDQLNPIDRDIMVYKFYHGLTNAEIAKLIGNTEGGVRLRYQRAKAKLVAMVAERGENHEDE